MPITPPKDLSKAIKDRLEVFNIGLQTAIEHELRVIGDKAVNIARKEHLYKDQTGNLTSSVGYVIIKDGKPIISGGFKPRYKSKKKNNIEGEQTGYNYAMSLASEYPDGYTLLVVAGMHYAAYVEAKGLGGMTIAELKARDMVEKLMKQLTKESYKMEEKIGKSISRMAKL